MEERLKDRDSYFKKFDYKLMVIERNLVRVMEKLEIPPVRELCDYQDTQF